MENYQVTFYHPQVEGKWSKKIASSRYFEGLLESLEYARDYAEETGLTDLEITTVGWNSSRPLSVGEPE